LALVGARHEVPEVRTGAHCVETRVAYERRRGMKSPIDAAFQQLERSIVIA
jgi:ASC-1-like (ASCH) protein